VSTTGPGRTDAARRDEIFAVVRDAVATVLERDPATITWDTGFEELQADSLALVEVAEIVEEQLAPLARRDVRIPDDDLERLTTVGDAVDLALAQL
jgi:acyl carrier protein